MHAALCLLQLDPSAELQNTFEAVTAPQTLVVGMVGEATSRLTHLWRTHSAGTPRCGNVTVDLERSTL